MWCRPRGRTASLSWRGKTGCPGSLSLVEQGTFLWRFSEFTCQKCQKWTLGKRGLPAQRMGVAPTSGTEMGAATPPATRGRHDRDNPVCLDVSSSHWWWCFCVSLIFAEILGLVKMTAQVTGVPAAVAIWHWRCTSSPVRSFPVDHNISDP